MSNDISSQRRGPLAPERPAPTPQKLRSFELQLPKPGRPLDDFQLPPAATGDLSFGSADLLDEQKLRLRAAAAGAYGAQALADVQTSMKALGNVPEPIAAPVLAQLGDGPGSDMARSISQVLASVGFTAGSPQQRAELVDLLGSVAPGDMVLVALLADNLRLAFNQDSRGATLVDNLDAIANQPLNPAINDASPQDLLHSVMMESISPATQVNQSSYGTCTVTSLEYALAAKQPAEYARLVAGLAGPSGIATMQGGGELDLQPEYYAAHLPNDDRSASEVLFQSATMDFGDGALDYDASTDVNAPQAFGGLTTDQQTQVAARLFNRPYVTWLPAQFNDIISALAVLQQLDGRKLPTPIVVDIKVGDLANPLYHALDFLGAADGEIYFRNPWGAGNFQPMLGITSVDPITGIYSMSYLDFMKRVTGMSIPVGR